ncbi:MAG: hypothetical protein ABIN94_11805 [Ferruginibacter sp.]
MKKMIILLAVVMAAHSTNAQVGSQFPDFYRVIFFGDTREYWAEDISPFKEGEIRVLRFCHSNSLYTINKKNGEIITSTGIYKAGKVQFMQALRKAEGGYTSRFSIFTFEDGSKFPGKITNTKGTIIQVTFVHSGSNYEFKAISDQNWIVTKSNGAYKVGAKAKSCGYDLQNAEPFSK